MADVLTLGTDAVLPRIAWESVLDDATLTTESTAEEDGALAQVADWTCWTFWRPTPAGDAHEFEADLGELRAVNVWALAGHDADGEVAMDYWDGADWVEHSAVVAAGDGACLYLIGDPVTTTKLRFRFASISFAAFVFAGTDMILPEGIGNGWTDPNLALRPELEPQVSRDGVYLGSAVKKWDAQLSIDLKNVEASWARTYWQPFLRACATQPFFLHWHKDDWPNSACLCTQAQFGTAAFASKGLVDLSVSFIADTGYDHRLTPEDDA